MGVRLGPAEGPSHPGPVPRGVTLLRRGQPLAAARTKVSAFGLLSHSAHGEVMHLALDPGGRLTLMPDPGIVETFYLVSGRLTYDTHTPEGALTLHPGDSFSTQGLDGHVQLVALGAAELVYAADTPLFGQLSGELRELRRLAVEVELKDGYTAEHCDRLQSLSYATALELGLPPARLQLLDYSAYLHDVGKVCIPLSILNKPGKLSTDEWAVIKQHPTYGRELLEPTFLRGAGVLVEQHHERFDGSGYPYGLAGDEISVEAAIIAVADTFDAMTTDRPYAAARTEAEATAELQRLAGVHYSSEVVRAFRASLCRATRTLFAG